MYIKQGANCNGGTQVKMLLVTLLHFFLSYQNLSLWNLTLLNLLNWINLLNAYLFVRHFLADAEQNSQLVLPHKISLIFLWLFTFSKAVLTCFSGGGGGGLHVLDSEQHPQWPLAICKTFPLMVWQYFYSSSSLEGSKTLNQLGKNITPTPALCNHK